jgi:hypothetical protein
MKINSSTELMKNQKHAVVMSPTNQFEVLQTQSGNSLFFSIGTDGIFYLTQESPSGATGWALQDLSTQLSSKFFSGATVTAKLFDVAQDLTANTTDIALVVTVGGNDYLFVSLGNVNTDTAWAANVQASTVLFTEMTFDDTTHNFSGLAISDISLIESGTTEYLIADILIDPTNPTKTIYRYFVDPTKKAFGKYWNPHDISNNLSAGAITNKVGRKSGQPMDGVYTMGQILGIPQLSYTPLYTITKKGSPDPTILVPPAGATAMALSVSKAPYTDLFVAAGGGLYYLSNTAQLSGTGPGSVYTHSLLQGVKSLHVNNTASQTIVWGLNEQQQLFYMTCAAGSEANTSSWSYPVAILDGVENVATFIQTSQKNLVVFAQVSDGLIQLVQDPASSKWTQRQILLPSTLYTDIVEDYTFTTHIELTDDNTLPLQNQAISLSASSTCSVYINDVYYTLFGQIPLQISTDTVGVITIVQAVDSLAGIAFTLTDGTTTNYVNPVDNLVNKLQNVSGDDLNTTVSDENGVSKNLLDTSVDSDTRDEIATYIRNFISLNSGLNPDGTPIADDGSGGLQATSSNAVFGVNFSGGKAKFYDSHEKAAALGIKPLLSPGISLSNGALTLVSSSGYDGSFDYGDPILILAGDGWSWLKNEFEKVERWEIQVFGKISHFIFEIAEQTYHFAIKCAHDIAEGIHFVLNKIAVAFEDMVKWLGMIFNFQDIKNTHYVLNNIFSIIINQLVTDVDGLQQQCTDVFSTIKDDISALTGLPTGDDTYGGKMSTATQTPGSKSPSANWGNHHLKSNADSASGDVDTPENTSQDPTGGLMAQLEADLVAAGANYLATLDQLKYLANNAGSMTIGEIALAATGILANLIVDGLETLVSFAITVIQKIISSVLVSLETPLQIPVISYLFEKVVGDELTALSLLTFIAAIPATVIIKITSGSAPFPKDDPTTQQLINAKDMATLQSIFNPPVAPAASPNAAMLLGGYHVDVGTALERATLAMNVCAGIGALAQSIVLFKTSNPGVEIPPSRGKVFTLINSSAYFLYAAPDVLSIIVATSDRWDIKLNTFLTSAACIKAIADASTVKWPSNPDWPFNPADAYANNVAPWLDFVINFIWLAPPVAAMCYRGVEGKINDNDIVSFIGNAFFDISGMLALAMMVAKKDQDPTTKRVGVTVAWAAIDFSNFIWGGSAIVTSFDGLAQPGS